VGFRGRGDAHPRHRAGHRDRRHAIRRADRRLPRPRYARPCRDPPDLADDPVFGMKPLARSWERLPQAIANTAAVILTLTCFCGLRGAMAGETYDGWMFFDGTELRELCKSSQPEKRKYCAMYICAMNDGW